MDDERQPYTPFPTVARPRVTPLVAAGLGSAPVAAAGSRQGLALFTAASLAIGSTVLAVSGTPRTAYGGPASESAGQLFETRTSAAVKPAEVPTAGAEVRESSPLPVAGSELTAAPASGAGAASSGPMAFHALTSFDNTMVMTSGSAPEQAGPTTLAEAVQAQGGVSDQRLTYTPPAPTTWNRPLKWYKVHKDGL